MMSEFKYDPSAKKWVEAGPRRVPRIVHDCSAPQPGPETAPRTEMVVQVTLSLQAHPDDVAAVLDRLQAAIKDATAAIEGRIAIEFALPEIVREATVR